MGQYRAPETNSEAQPNPAGRGRHRDEGFPIGEPYRNMNRADIARLTDDDEGERYNRPV